MISVQQKNKQNRPCRFVKNQICKVFFHLKTIKKTIVNILIAFLCYNKLAKSSIRIKKKGSTYYERKYQKGSCYLNGLAIFLSIIFVISIFMAADNAIPLQAATAKSQSTTVANRSKVKKDKWTTLLQKYEKAKSKPAYLRKIQR